MTVAIATSTTLPKKLPNEDCFADFDFTALFATGVVISNPVFRAWDKNDLETELSADIINQSATIDGMIASQLVSDGDPGTTYLIEMHVDGDDGSSQAIQLLLPVVQKRLG